MLRLRIAFAVSAALFLTLVSDQAFAQPSCAGAPPAICPLGQPSGQDCRIDVDCTVGSSAPYPPFDFGTRRLVVTKTITVGGDGILRVVAGGGVALDGAGTIRAVGAGQGFQRVELVSAGNIMVASGAAIDVSSSAGTLQFPGSGGSIDLDGASVQIAGTLSADGIGRDTYGGYVDVVAAGDVSVAKVDVKGGDRAGGGDASFYAGGTITASAPIRAQGLDGGGVSFDAGGDVLSLSEIEVQATGPDGAGGSVDAYAIGSVTIGGAVSGKGLEGVHEDGRADTGGDGADVTIEAVQGSVAINANVDLSGAPSGYGGDLDVSADLDVVVAGKIALGAAGLSGSGSVGTEIVAGRNLTISKDIDATSPASGGDLVFEAGGTLAILSPARIRVDGASDPFAGSAGSIVIQGDCAVQIASGTVLSAMGAGAYPYASNDVRAASLTIGGTLQAGSENRLEYGTVNLQGTAKLIPAAPLPGPTPTAPCCGGCATTTTTTVTLPPTTTSTTLPPTTTSTTTTTTTTSAPTSSSTTVSSTTTLESTTSTSASSSTTLVTTTEPAITSTTVTTSTTTTTDEPASTTSTTAPPPGAECIGRPSAADVASCRIDALADTLGASPIDDLGGKATARRLNALLGRAHRFLDSAGNGAQVKGNLRKARRELKSFERAVKQGLKRKRSTIDAALGEFILGLAADATNDVGVMQAKLR